MQPKFDSTLRRRSVGTVEINGPDGRRKTVDLGDMSEADRQLAEQFGYKPVRSRMPLVGITTCLLAPLGLQARIRILVHLFIRCQYQWPFRDRCNHFLVPSLRWRSLLGSMVLAHFRRWVHVHRLLCCRTRLSVSN